MNLIDLSIRRSVFAWVLMFSMIVFGAISLSRLGISQMPDVDFPVITISVAFEGAAPEVVETDLIEPIEQRLLGIEGVKEMRSTANQGSASVVLEFDINRNVETALQEVQSALSQLKLPPGIDPPIIKKTNPEEDPILIVSISGGKSLRDMILWTTRQVINNQISFKIKDVATVEDGLADVRRMARVGGESAVAIQVRKQRGTNEVTVADAVQKKLAELQTRRRIMVGKCV